MTLTTYTGQHVDPTDVKVAQINIEDIAHALALINRFCGHTPVPISVAQHSVLVSSQCPPHLALRGLLHDASEAYLGDVIRPIKHTGRLDGYLALEAQLQSRIYAKYHCCEDPNNAVDAADRLALEVEIAVSFPIEARPIQPSHDAHLLALAYSVWPWRQAERVFLERFYDLRRVAP